MFLRYTTTATIEYLDSLLHPGALLLRELEVCEHRPVHEVGGGRGGLGASIPRRIRFLIEVIGLVVVVEKVGEGADVGEAGDALHGKTYAYFSFLWENDLTSSIPSTTSAFARE